MRTGKHTPTLTGLTDFVSSLAVLNANEIASGGGGFDEGTIKIWDLRKGKSKATRTGHTIGVTCLIEMKANEIASGAYDKSIKIWDLSAGHMNTY